MERRDKLIKKDPVRLVIIRSTLSELANRLCFLESEHDLDACLEFLAEEIRRLQQRDTGTMLWRQVCRSVMGPDRYGLERLRLLPDGDDEQKVREHE